MKKTPLLILLAALLIGVVLTFPLYAEYLSLDGLKQVHQKLADTVAARPFTSGMVYFLVYVFVVAVSIPGAAILTLAGGALFGFFWGTVLVSFASTLGATLAFLIVRFLLRDTVAQRFKSAYQLISDGFQRDGNFYLFSLRIVPAVPFFVVNILMALTRIPVRWFFLISQVGMLPATLIYVYAGTELSKIQAIEDILSPGLIFALCLIALFPWLARWILNRLKHD